LHPNDNSYNEKDFIKSIEIMKANNALIKKLIKKLIHLTKQIYLNEPEDGSGLLESFMTGKHLGSSFGMEWWINRGVFECCEDIADIAIRFDPQLEGGDKESFSKIIRETLRENAINPNLFTFDSLFLRRASTLFEARAIKNPDEFASHLWNEIHRNLANSLVQWLIMYPLRLVRTDSFILGFDGLTLLRANDQDQWKKLSENYDESQYWMPSTGTWANGISDHTHKDFLFSTWLVCEASGTASGARSIAGDSMRTFIAILCSCLDDQIPNLLTKSGADPTSYSIQFPHDASRAGSISAGIGNLFPPLLVNNCLHISSDILSEIQSWYELRSNALDSAAQRATTAAHFINYGIVYDGIERFIHFFIALDALFGEHNNVEKNIKEGIRKTFPGQKDWEDRADKLFEIRNELVHGGISSIKRWAGLDHYRCKFKSHPMKDIQTAAMTALRVYFSNQVFEHLYCSSKIMNEKMIEYTVIYERGQTNWGAYVPDLPGCVSIGDTLAEVQENIREAIALYLEVLKEDGQPIPEPSTQVGKVAVTI
jgi:predicted RNase H-like HicB family nuclease